MKKSSRSQCMHLGAVAVFTLSVIGTVCAGGVAAQPQGDSGDRNAPPAPYCVHAREIVETRQSDPQTLAIRLKDESRYRVELADVCPGATRGERLRLVSKAGWLCGSNDEKIQADGRTCAVSGMAKIDAREFAVHALAEHRGEDDGNLDTIEVTGKRRRGFGGTTAYCLDIRHVRGWAEDGDGAIVEVAARRSGGHQRYRVEFASACSDMSSAPQMQLISGMGLNVICGNAGDRMVLFRDDPETAGFLRRRAESGLAAQAGCPIKTVYPLLTDEKVAASK